MQGNSVESKVNPLSVVQEVSWMAVFLSFLMMSGCRMGQQSSTRSFQSVPNLGKLSVGKSLPTYAGTSESGLQASNKPAEHKSLIHLLHTDLPPLCVNEECGAFGSIANLKGADLYGGSDLKLADQVFGIFPTDNEAFKEQSQNYGVLIISDQQAKIKAIYQNVDLPDMESILQDSEAILAQTD